MWESTSPSNSTKLLNTWPRHYGIWLPAKGSITTAVTVNVSVSLTSSSIMLPLLNKSSKEREAEARLRFCWWHKNIIMCYISGILHVLWALSTLPHIKLVRFSYVHFHLNSMLVTHCSQFMGMFQDKWNRHFRGSNTSKIKYVYVTSIQIRARKFLHNYK